MATTERSGLYGGYLKNVQQYYDREPVVRASLQLLLSIFTVAFFAFVAIRPTLSTITTLVKKIEDQKVADEKLNTKLVQLADAQEFLSNNGESLGELSKLAVPDSPELKRLAQAIELSANQSGVLITDLGFQPAPLVADRSLTQAGAAGGATKERFLTFSFAVGGAPTQLIDFLDRLERMDRVVTLTNLVFSKPQTKAQGTLPLSVSGRATAYYLPLTSTIQQSASADTQ